MVSHIKLFQPRLSASFFLPQYWLIWLVLLAIFVLAYMPKFVRYFIGNVLGRLYYIVYKKGRTVAMTNLRLCFPDQSADERNKMVRQCFYCYGQIVPLYAVLWFRSSRYITHMTRYIGLHHLQRAIDNGDNVILINAHMIGIDWCGVTLSQFIPSVSFINPVNNRLLDYLHTRYRTRYGGIVIDRNSGVMNLARALKVNPCYIASYDTSGDAQRAVFAPFFGDRKSVV